MSQVLLRQYITPMILMAGLVAFGCGDCGDDGVGQTDSGRILVSPNPVGFPQVEAGTSSDQSITVANISQDDPLTIFEINLVPRDGGSANGLSLVDLPSLPFEIGPDDIQTFTLRYAPQAGAPPARAQLNFISTDDRYTRENPLSVPVDTLGNQPQLEAIPNIVRFPRLPPGNREEQPVVIRNVGTAPLIIAEEPFYSGGADFRISVEPRTYPLELPVYDPSLALDNPAAYELSITTEYAPVGEGADQGAILVTSNDPSGMRTGDNGFTVREIDVQASAQAPCILVDGLTRNFGQIPLGRTGTDVVQVSNCGTQTLEITDIVMAENSPDNEFELVLGEYDRTGNGELDETIRLVAGASMTFTLRYVPASAGTDRGRVRIFSNDPLQGELDLLLLARGSEGICPVASAGAYVRGVSTQLRTSLTANPLQYIVLDGSASSDEDGVIVEYMWDITGPPGVNVVLGPTNEDVGDMNPARRQFRLLTAGRYEVELRVRDNDGFESCNTASVVITAIPNQTVHVELTWTNPADPDETNDLGSDVDLHLVKMGPGRWFEAPYDIYFRNPNNSGDGQGIWNPESPSLDIDARNGLGPENITMDDPAPCEWYAIGVHYYRELFGTAYATIRVYIAGNLVFEELNRPLTRGGQFWDVGRIHWDSGQVFTAGTVTDVAPAGQQPEVTASMVNSGLCTNQGLYSVQ